MVLFSVVVVVNLKSFPRMSGSAAMCGDATDAATLGRCAKVVGGTSAAEVGVGVEAPHHNVTKTDGRRWRNVTRVWKGPVVKEEVTCVTATGVTE